MNQKPAIKIGRSTVQFFLPGPKGQKVYWVGDYNQWSTNRRLRYSVKDRGYTYRIKARPDGIYFYKYVVNQNWILDPNNPNRYDNGPFGTNSYVTMPKYRFPTEINHNPLAPRGHITRVMLNSEALKSEREVFIYTPPQYESGDNYPLLVLQDGHECVSLLPAQTLFDNLIHQKVCKAFVCVMVSPRSSHEREKDYIFNNRFEKFLGDELIRWLHEHYKLSHSRQDRAILGYSLGGLVSIRTALHYPHVYGMGGSESGAFWPRQGAIYHEVIDCTPFSTRFYLGTGDMDGGEQLSYIMAEFFRSLGVPYTIKVSVGGHDWFYWKTHLRHSLKWFFPGTQR